MNEEQLADLLTQHLDALLEGGSLPENLPPEVADLLAVAQSVSEAAPSPRPEFGAALKASLLGPTVGGNGATPSAGSALSGQTMSLVMVGLLAGAALLAIVVSIIILGVVSPKLGSSTATPAPLQTQTTPAQSTPSPVATTQTAEATITNQVTQATSTPTITPVVDVLPAITITIEIVIEPPALVPGSAGGGGNGNDGGGDGSSDGGDDDGGDHDRGHGNDPDHHDEDNPGKGGGK